jgi:hypothetical protein
MDNATFIAKYNNSSTGLFKDNISRDIEADDQRSLVADIAASFVNLDAATVDHWRGAYDLSVNAYPSSGGTGTSGVPGAGDEWYVSVPGSIDVTGLGTITVNANSLLKYKGGDPTLASSWIVTQQ